MVGLSLSVTLPSVGEYPQTLPRMGIWSLLITCQLSELKSRSVITDGMVPGGPYEERNIFKQRLEGVGCKSHGNWAGIECARLRSQLKSHMVERSLSARNKVTGGWTPVDKRVWEQRERSEQ